MNNRDNALEGVESKGFAPKEINPYNQKIKKYIVKIIIEIILIGCFVGLVLFVHHLDIKSDEKYNKEIAVIGSNIAKLQTDVSNVEGKILEVRAYKERWDKSSNELITLDKIDSNYLQKKVNSIISKHKIHNLIINAEPKKEITLEFLDLRKLYLESSSGKISFSVMIDVGGIDFIENLINVLPGFFVITKISIMKKNDKYVSKDILDIKRGGYDKFIVDFNIDYMWYVIRRR